MVDSGIYVSWLYEDRILFVKMVGDLTVKHFEQFDKEVNAHLDEGELTIFIVCDTANMNKVSGNPLGIHKVITHFDHPNLGDISIAGVNPAIRFLASTVFQVLGKRVSFHKSFDGAVESILQSDEALPDSIDVTHLQHRA